MADILLETRILCFFRLDPFLSPPRRGDGDAPEIEERAEEMGEYEGDETCGKAMAGEEESGAAGPEIGGGGSGGTGNSGDVLLFVVIVRVGRSCVLSSFPFCEEKGNPLVFFNAILAPSPPPPFRGKRGVVVREGGSVGYNGVPDAEDRGGGEERDGVASRWDECLSTPEAISPCGRSSTPSPSLERSGVAIGGGVGTERNGNKTGEEGGVLEWRRWPPPPTFCISVLSSSCAWRSLRWSSSTGGEVAEGEAVVMDPVGGSVRRGSSGRVWLSHASCSPFFSCFCRVAAVMAGPCGEASSPDALASSTSSSWGPRPSSTFLRNVEPSSLERFSGEVRVEKKGSPCMPSRPNPSPPRRPAGREGTPLRGGL